MTRSRVAALAADTGVWILRLALGAVFIVSGWSKAIDLWGVVYKMTEYFTALNISMPRGLTVGLAVALSAFEFCLGILLATGSMRRGAVLLAVVTMLVMTPFTGWIAATDPVAECGCFGDLILLSNRTTFIKNIVITLGVVALWFVNRRTRGLITPKMQMFAVLASGTYAFALCMVGFAFQPMVDFRAYGIGKQIAGADADLNVQMVYARNGQERVFTLDSLPGDDWTFVRRYVQQSVEESGITFSDSWGDDATQDVLTESPKGVLLDVVNRREASLTARPYKTLGLARAAAKHGYSYAIAVPLERMSDTAAVAMLGVPVYGADASALKTLVRGDEALVLIRDGRVSWKYNMDAIPTNYGNPQAPLGTTSLLLPMDKSNADPFAAIQPVEKTNWLWWLTGAYALAMLILAGLRIDLKMRRIHRIHPEEPQ